MRFTPGVVQSPQVIEPQSISEPSIVTATGTAGSTPVQISTVKHPTPSLTRTTSPTYESKSVSVTISDSTPHERNTKNLGQVGVYVVGVAGLVVDDPCVKPAARAVLTVRV
jgi:hypothetical protein